MKDSIKQKALENHIPILMDDTLEVIAKILKQNNPKSILEIGTAVGYSAICFSEFLTEGGKIDTIERDLVNPPMIRSNEDSTELILDKEVIKGINDFMIINKH